MKYVTNTWAYAKLPGQRYETHIPPHTVLDLPDEWIEAEKPKWLEPYTEGDPMPLDGQSARPPALRRPDLEDGEEHPERPPQVTDPNTMAGIGQGQLEQTAAARASRDADAQSKAKPKRTADTEV